MVKSDKTCAESRTKKVKISQKWLEDFDDDYDKSMDKGAYYNTSKKRKKFVGNISRNASKDLFYFSFAQY